MKLYLDHAASSPLSEETLNFYTYHLKNSYANSMAIHSLGKRVYESVEKSREDILHYLGLKKSLGFHLLFTSSATESNNFIIRGKSEISPSLIYISSKADHPSLVKPITEMKKREIEFPLNSFGEYDFSKLELRMEELQLKDLDSSSELFFALTWVNNTSGTINDLITLCQKIKKCYKRAFIHIDGVQGFSKIHLNFSEVAFDSLTISGHKSGGPKGVAALIFNKNSLKGVRPLLYGGGQEDQLRGGTLNAPAILAWAFSLRENINLARNDELHQLQKEKIIKRLREGSSLLQFPFVKSGLFQINPFILLILTPKVSGDIIIRYLEQKEIYLSSSAACTSKNRKLFTQLETLHIPKELQACSIRVSFRGILKEDEIDFFCESFLETYNKLVRMRNE